MWFSAPKRMYLDYASATPVLPQAELAVRRSQGIFGNPGAIHSEGVAAARALEESRDRIALELGCKSREIVFVSGGTEANNLAILGYARQLAILKKMRHSHWIVSAIEHPSVLDCFGEVERLGGSVTYVEPDERGIISVEAVSKTLKPKTVFISIGWANHEIGTIQSIRDISRAIREKRPEILIHTDAGQAPLYISPQVHTLDADLVSFDSGKLYGPRGIGALYVGNRASLSRIMQGGGQERGLRAGTENVALAAGFAEAMAQIGADRSAEVDRIVGLRDALAAQITSHVPSAVINGDLRRILPHILNISIPDIASEYVTLALDQRGIAISTKSACREGEESRSHVVDALRGEEWRAATTLRFSLGRSTRRSDIARVSATLAEVLKKRS